MDDSTLTITLLHETDEDGRLFIHEAIKAFNNVHSPHHQAIRTEGPEPLEVYIRDDAGEIVGGLTAKLYWGWLSVDDLWLHESLRGQGYGRKLLLMVETAAKEKGITRALLQTFSFQARGFYEKQGYCVVGEIAEYPPGSCFYTLCKTL